MQCLISGTYSVISAWLGVGSFSALSETAHRARGCKDETVAPKMLAALHENIRRVGVFDSGDAEIETANQFSKSLGNNTKC
jgi:hypothetical protein